MSKIIFISGGTGVIGSELIVDYLKNNWTVICTTRNSTNINKLIRDRSLQDHAQNLHPIIVDFEDDGCIEKIKDYLIDCNKKPCAMVHAARSLDYLKCDENGRCDKNSLDKEYYYAVILPYMLVNCFLDFGNLNSVVLISSIYGIVAPTLSLYENYKSESPIQYGIAKAGEIHLVKELAVRLADKKVRVNAVSYGGIKGRVNNEFEERYNNFTPSGRMMDQSDIAGPVKFLISNDSSYVTGHNLIVDGGWTTW